MGRCRKQKCNAWALRDSEYCYWHDTRPEIVQKRRTGQRRGGRRGTVPSERPVESLEDVRRILGDVLIELHSKRKLTRDQVFRLRAIGFISNVMITAIEKADLERRVSLLEKNLLPQETPGRSYNVPY